MAYNEPDDVPSFTSIMDMVPRYFQKVSHLFQPSDFFRAQKRIGRGATGIREYGKGPKIGGQPL